ncbi:FecR family protein [Echinicola soli]|uniref:FecR family protein n=1 Tax=Echinicola soli TaxID=2591634 RepID=A0A514CJB6_9BACT|nr:FecR family protein [Echinicola soli]QDH79870.1 FecR family protein [Echinicola soli]
MKGFYPNTIEDFLKFPAFIEWVNDPTMESNEQWEKWCQKYPDKVHLLQHAKDLLHSMQLEETNSMELRERDKLLDTLLVENSAYKKKRIRDHRDRLRKNTTYWIRGVAASLLLIGVLVLGKVLVLDEKGIDQQKITWTEKAVPRGMKKMIYLPDGTKVTLNSGSVLSYASNFENNRSVKLKGQAFFEVQRDKDHPFRIKSGEITTTVLGTSFDVKAYDDEQELHVAVMSGKVEVESERGLVSYLEKGEVSYYRPDLPAMRKSGFDYEELIGWKHKIIKFNQASYQQVFSTLSKWYDVDFKVDPALKIHGKYTAKFQNQSLPNVLIGLEHSSNLDFRIKGKTVLVSSK